jgi:hypothetical protein
LVNEKTVRDIELGMMQDTIQKEWDLDSSFSLKEHRNSEVYMVMRELEELAWRTSAEFSERDYQGVKEMVSIDRNWQAFDKDFYGIDMESMD